MPETTKPARKRPAARRVFAETARWLRCSSVTDRSGSAPSSRLAIEPFPQKQDPSLLFRQALRKVPGVRGDICREAKKRGEAALFPWLPSDPSRRV